jgi:hypothetical protein
MMNPPPWIVKQRGICRGFSLSYGLGKKTLEARQLMVEHRQDQKTPKLLT